MEALAAAPVNGTAELGATLTLRVQVSLDALAPEDVEVQAFAGRVDAQDVIRDGRTFPLKPAAGPDLEGRWVYEGPLALDRTGPFGYTVRILAGAPAAGDPGRTGPGRVPGGHGRGRRRTPAVGPAAVPVQGAGGGSTSRSPSTSIPARLTLRRAGITSTCPTPSTAPIRSVRYV